MQAVWRLGSYIIRGMYTVVGPFRPFGGAVDIVVVQQQDGSFKSSPWYVRLGKFQGILNAKEKVVNISVNGIEADFHMYLDHKGEAFFLKEVDTEEVESMMYQLSSGYDTDNWPQENMQRLKSKSCNFNSGRSNSAAQIDINNGEIVARTNSRRSWILGLILGLVFGRRSMKGNKIFQGQVEDGGIHRTESLERADVAANLLEVMWSTKLAGNEPPWKNCNKSQKRTSECDSMDNRLDQRKFNEVASSCSEQEGISSKSDFEVPKGLGEEKGVNPSCLSNPDKVVETFVAGDFGTPVTEVSATHFQHTDSSLSVNLDLGHRSVQKVGLDCFATISSYSSLGNQAVDENNTIDKDVLNTSSLPLESVGDCVHRKPTSSPPSACSEEESFLFSDLDECRINYQCEGSMSPEYFDKEDHPSNVDAPENVQQLLDANHNLHSSPKNSTAENQTIDLEKLRVASGPIVIPKNEVVSEEVGRQTGSLPNMSLHSKSLGHHDVCYPLSCSMDSKSKSLNWSFPGKDDFGCPKPDQEKQNKQLHEKPGAEDKHISGEFKSTVLNPPIGDPSTLCPSPGGNWRLWPFSFRRSKTRKAMLSAHNDAKNTTPGNASDKRNGRDGNKNEPKPHLMKKRVTARTPSSEQLASLNLKEGRNIVTFTFSTAMLGKQQIDARIHLLKWNTRIVISDVDGTITKSDVLGQIMPLVGIDWSQTGVANLFSAIKENGYQLLFLSARAISQAYHTRQFLFNLKQDGKALPDGPVVISPDGLFPSLYREVIRRAPHEFKIECLEDIKALFPSDCNPFYAGFGNRDTDEFSYLKVGIPEGKIFIINPKGKVAVNHRLETKSYTSLYPLVNGMFPPMNSSEQEDFNTWNYWKLPPPVVDI